MHRLGACPEAGTSKELTNEFILILLLLLIEHLGKTKAIVLYSDPTFSLRSELYIKCQEGISLGFS